MTHRLQRKTVSPCSMQMSSCLEKKSLFRYGGHVAVYYLLLADYRNKDTNEMTHFPIMMRHCNPLTVNEFFISHKR